MINAVSKHALIIPSTSAAYAHSQSSSDRPHMLAMLAMLLVCVLLAFPSAEESAARNSSRCVSWGASLFLPVLPEMFMSRVVSPFSVDVDSDGESAGQGGRVKVMSLSLVVSVQMPDTERLNSTSSVATMTMLEVEALGSAEHDMPSIDTGE